MKRTTDHHDTFRVVECPARVGVYKNWGDNFEVTVTHDDDKADRTDKVTVVFNEEQARTLHTKLTESLAELDKKREEEAAA